MIGRRSYSKLCFNSVSQFHSGDSINEMKYEEKASASRYRNIYSFMISNRNGYYLKMKRLKLIGSLGYEGVGVKWPKANLKLKKTSKAILCAVASSRRKLKAGPSMFGIEITAITANNESLAAILGVFGSAEAARLGWLMAAGLREAAEAATMLSLYLSPEGWLANHRKLRSDWRGMINGENGSGGNGRGWCRS